MYVTIDIRWRVVTMKRIEIKLSEEEIKILEKESKKNPKLKVRNKAKVLLLRNKGYSDKEIMNKTDLTAATIIAYVKLYNKNGIDSIYTTECKGQKGLLVSYEEEIIEDFLKKSPLTRDEARQRIFEKYEIKIGKTAMGNFLKKTGCRTKNQEVSQRKQKKKNNKYSWTLD